MSVSGAEAAPRSTALRPPAHPLLRIAIMVVAVVVTAGVLAGIAWVAGHTVAPPAPPRNPFGTGLRETAPSGAFASLLLAMQSRFYQALTSGLQVIATTGSGLWTLIGVGLAYGVFHAAGPGHGKGVISGYLLANRQTLVKGFGLSLAAAALQALVAIAIVAVLGIVLAATAATVSATANAIELASFGLVAVVGALLLWRKAGALAALTSGETAGGADDCGHAHMPTAEDVRVADTLRARLGVILAAGTRPCSGAIILLVFALSQKTFGVGVLATLAMALGTALTTGLIAAMAVFAKSMALRIAGGRGRTGTVVVSALEVLAGAFVFVLGAALAAGLASAGAG